MNRLAAIVVLIIGIVAGIVFGFFPDLDLKVAEFFYDATSKDFPFRLNPSLEAIRHLCVGLVWFIFLFSVLWNLTWAWVRPAKRRASSQAVIFLILSMAIGPGLLVNVGLKNNWGRSRPVEIRQFGSNEQFVPWWNPQGDCKSNCSFVTGESSFAFWTLAPASLVHGPLRLYAYGFAIVFGVFVGFLRISFGGHFASDVIFAGVFTYFTIWILRVAIFSQARFFLRQTSGKEQV